MGASLKDAVILAALTGFPKDIGEILFSLISKVKLSLTSIGLGLFNLCWMYLDMFPSVFHVWRSHMSFLRNEPRDIIISSLNLLVQHFMCVIHCL